MGVARGEPILGTGYLILAKTTTTPKRGVV
jgi:hypothetical protein